MQPIERTYRGRLNGKLMQSMIRCINTFNSSKLGKYKRKTLLLAKFSFTRTFVGNERVDIVVLVWDTDKAFPKWAYKQWFHCEDHGLLEKRIVESLPKHLRKI